MPSNLRGLAIAVDDCNLFYAIRVRSYALYKTYFTELESLFSAINSPDDGGEEKLEETRSLKPVRKY